MPAGGARDGSRLTLVSAHSLAAQNSIIASYKNIFLHFLGPLVRKHRVFTMHDSTMIFLFAVPMMFQGFGVYVVPLMCGARNIDLCQSTYSY